MSFLVEIWRQNPVRSFLLSGLWVAIGVAGTIVIILLSSYGPSVIIRHDEKNDVTVRGVNVTVLVDQMRRSSPCPGAYADRRMVRIGPDGKVKDVQFIKEHGIGVGDVGVNRYTLHLHLFAPLSGDGWLYKSEINDNCSIFSGLFMHSIVSIKPAPANIMPDGSADGEQPGGFSSR